MTCGCCIGVRTETPAPVYNRPGLPALSYRVGNHGAFLESMIARLSSRPALAGLTTREPDDPAIALLDCWAVVADVLTFYQERIANEGYLRTATEPESLTRLGRLVGYAPRPPLGASTHLAYTLDPGATSVIPTGSAARNVPAQGQLPETYETSEELVAREEWNTLAVRRADPPDINLGNVDSTLTRVDVDGTAANLKAGDRLLFQFGVSAAPHARVVRQATADFIANRTRVTFVSAEKDPGELSAAVTALAAELDTATHAEVVGRNRFANAIATYHLIPLRKVLDPAKTSPEQVLGDTIAGQLRQLPEEEAIARPHADCALAAWFDGQFRAVLDAGAVLVALAAQLARTSPPEVVALRDLARRIVCGDEREFLPPPPCPDPSRAVGLVGLTPILPALRREPSRPPRNAAALRTGVAELFRPDSDVHPRLLVAADPRLGPNLYQAWSRQQIAPPPPLASLQVMRTRATVSEVQPSDPPAPAPDTLILDAVYDGILAGLPVVVGADPDLRVAAPRRVDVGQSPDGLRRATRLEFDAKAFDSFSDIKPGTQLWAQGQELVPVGDPVVADVAGDRIELARSHPGLGPGRWVIVSGERTDVPYTSGVPASELAMVAGISQRVDPDKPGDTVRTTLRLANALAYRYARATVTVYGNVVAATQGETRNEVLGSGDAGLANQTFPLRQVLAETPLTWLPADNPFGADDTLITRVNGVAWHERDGLIWSGPADHVYLLRSGPGSGDAVAFGDGLHGARLPTGSENVTATYRTGAGPSGNVPAGTITQLAARPLGVSAVTNPLPATGGVDGDGPGDVRATVPLRMQALDRLVSVRDYEDFTRARAGIGKASAARLFDGKREVVHVTIAGIGDVPIDPLSGLFGSLEAALRDFGDIGAPVRVAVRELQLLMLSAGVKVLPDYSWDLVAPAVRAALLAEFGFGNRLLGQPAYLSAAVTAIQRVPGVDYVDVDVFQAIPGDVTPIQLASIVDGLAGSAACIPALPARYSEKQYQIEDGDTLTSIAGHHGLSLDELVRLNPGLTTIALTVGADLVVARGIRPAQLAVLPANVPETVILRRIP